MAKHQRSAIVIIVDENAVLVGLTKDSTTEYRNITMKLTVVTVAQRVERSFVSYKTRVSSSCRGSIGRL